MDCLSIAYPIVYPLGWLDVKQTFGRPIRPGTDCIGRPECKNYDQRSVATQCKPVQALSLFFAPMHLCTHSLHEMARERGDLISSGMILFRFVGGITFFGRFLISSTISLKRSKKRLLKQ